MEPIIGLRLVPALPYLLGFAAGAMMYVVVEEMIPEMSQGRHSHIGVLAFAAGAMISVAVEELIPEAQLGEHSHAGTISVMTGFLIMMLLDVLLG